MPLSVSLWPDLGKALLPAIPPFVVGMLVWSKDVTSTARRIRRIDESTKRVIFWKEWHQTLQAHSLSELEANFPLRAELLDCAEQVMLISPTGRAGTILGLQAVATDGQIWQRLFLLVKHGGNEEFLLMRAAYWGYILFVPLAAAVRIWRYDHPLPGRTHTEFWLTTVVGFAVILGVLVFCRANAAKILARQQL